jgi:hypothetical protein
LPRAPLTCALTPASPPGGFAQKMKTAGRTERGVYAASRFLCLKALGNTAGNGVAEPEAG